MASKADHARAVVDGLEVFDPETPSCLPSLARELNELLDAQSAIYRLTLDDGGWAVEAAAASGPAFTTQELLQTLAAPIAKRLAAERALGHGVFGSPFEAAVESNPRAVFMVSPGGTITYANRSGADLLGRQRASTLETVRDAIRSPEHANGVDVRRLDGRGGARGHLVTLRWEGMDTESRIVATAARWSLTPRETEVLRLVVRGDANKDIATKLGASVATIEVHVSHVLKKAKSESRTALVATFYTS